MSRGAELDELRAFEAVARLGSVARAATELHRTQPSISARLAGLEAAWGTRLFVRRARGMELSAEGSSLLPAARAVLDGATALDRKAGVPLVDAASVRLGAGDALGQVLVPQVLRNLLEEKPGLSVRVREGSGEALLADLRAGSIDLALVPHGAGAAQDPGVERRPLCSSRVVLLVPPRLLRGRSSVRVAELGQQPLVLLLPGSSFRRHVEAAWAAAGVIPNVAVEVGSYSLARRFVAAGLGASPVPALVLEQEQGKARDGVRTLELKGVTEIAWDLAIRAGSPVSEPTLRLIELLQQPRRARR